MRKHQLLFVLGSVFVALGFAALLQPSVLAQETDAEEPPFLAEFYDQWVTSPHADAEAEAFVHWNEEADQVIPETCAKCHSTPGYRDFMGADGTEFGKVDAPAPLGTVITCDACHNSVASSLATVVFPSGAELTDTGDSARCMECHQGRASGASVDAKLVELGLTEDLNKPNEELGFINIHYYAAAATLYGSAAGGGYQFEGKVYEVRNQHVPGFGTCADCHNPHTLEIRVDKCAECHEDVETVEDLPFIRMNGSLADYDGDGDTDEGISEEIDGLQEMLYEAIQAYAKDVAGAAILYDELAYPYFFLDANDNGTVDEGEGKYTAFTGNLLKAAYNYQVVQKDPGGFAHNPTYQIHLLYDSIEMLNAQFDEPVVDLSTAERNSRGHFDTTGEPFRHWDEDGAVPGSCAKCHTGAGLATYIANGTNIAAEPTSSLQCATCHTSLSEFTILEVAEVTFPSGAKLSFGEEEFESNLCINCHQGRESTVSVNRAISGAGVGDDEVSDKLTFRNIHYFAAGATLFGSEAQGAYQFEGKEYNGRNMHGGEDSPMMCTECHDTHALENPIEDCQECHEDVETVEDVRLLRVEPEGVEAVDFDGDGDAAEPIRDEIGTMQEALYAAIQAYAKDKTGVDIIYVSYAHPYWYIDANGNGTVEPEEVNSDGRFVTWTPNLLRAAFNYQYSMKDPGVYAHNPEYVLQFLYDSIEAVGGDVSAYSRPAVVASAE